jgi:hypothetical protein
MWVTEEIAMRDSYQVFHDLLKKCYEGDVLNREICKYYAEIIKSALVEFKEKSVTIDFFAHLDNHIYDHCQRYLFNNNKALAEIDINSQPNL